MCYAGCRYELTWGESAGECSLPNGEKPPRDAMCSVNEIEAENAKLRELVEELYPLADYGAMDASELDRAHDLMRELGIEVYE